MPFVSFVVPTMWRPTLDCTLDSLVAQTDRDWECLVVADPGYEPTAWTCDDPRVRVLLAEEGGYAGPVRNVGIDAARGEWVGFVDDDDTVTPDYVASLRERNEDVVLFRRRDGGHVLPGDRLEPGAVGIHYAVRRAALGGRRFPKDTVHGEEWDLFESLRDAGSDVHVSDRVAYLVWGGRWTR